MTESNNPSDDSNPQKPGQWAVFSGLVGLTALFGSIVYVSGYVYTKVYFGEFYISLDLVEWSVTSCMIAFIYEVVLQSTFSFLTSMAAALFFAAVFFVAWRARSPALGYAVMCLLLVGLFAAATWSAQRAAKKAAFSDWTTETSRLPKLQAKPVNLDAFDEPFARKLQKRSLRLLYESNEFLYLVETKAEGAASALPVHVMPKSKLVSFEISNSGREGS